MSEKVFELRQSISAGNEFDDTVPSTTPTIGNGVKSWPIDTHGGRFEFDNLTSHVRVESIYVRFGACAAGWVVNVVTPVDIGAGVTVNAPVEIASGVAADTEFILEDFLEIPYEAWIEIQTSGAAADMVAIVKYERSAMAPGWQNSTVF